MELNFLLIVAIGFAAQMIDGTLGMGYGIISSSVLLVTGASPALASSSVHLSKIMTSGASGLSHWRFGNVDRRLLFQLLPAGMLGGIVGAVAISALPTDLTRTFVGLYLLLTGVLLLWRAIRQQPESESQSEQRQVWGLGAVGGFLDAIGGGGWGPVVTSTLLARGNHPRLAIGSASLAEFFVAVAISGSLTFSSKVLPFDQLQVILGLIIGGMLAAPIAAYVCGWLPRRMMTIFVGLLIIVIAIGIL